MVSQKKSLSKSILVFFSVFFLMASFFSVGIYAQDATDAGATNPDATANTDAGADSELTFADSGMNPSSPLYFTDRLWEDITLTFTGSPEEKVELEAKYLEERYSEMYNMVLNENYNAVERASGEAGKIYQKMGEHIQDFEVADMNMEGLREEDSSFDYLIKTHYEVMEDMKYAEHIEELLTEKTEQGEVSQEIVKDVFREIEDSKSGFEKEIRELKEDYIEAVATTDGLAKLDVELAVDDIEKENGLNALYREGLVYKNYKEVYDDIGELEEKAEELKEQGETEKAEAIEALVENTELMIQDSYFAFDYRDYNTAYVDYNDARDYIITGKEAMMKNNYNEIQNMIHSPE